MNISDLIDQYEQGARLRGLAPTQMNALKPVRRGLGRRTPGGLTPGTISRYVGERRRGVWSEVHGCRQAADGTIRRELGALAAVLAWAHGKRLLKDAPPTIDLPAASPPRTVVLTKEDAERLWVHASVMPNNTAARFACVALETWSRAAAVETLPWDRVDLERRQIDFNDPSKPQTSKRRARVPMSTRLHGAMSGWTQTGLVVGPVTQYAWRKLLKPLGLDVTRHDIRRTGISHAIAAGKDIAKVAAMAADDIATIQKYYWHHSPDYLSGLVD